MDDRHWLFISDPLGQKNKFYLTNKGKKRKHYVRFIVCEKT